MPTQIAQHQHCAVCRRAMEWDETNRACSPECKAKLDTLNKKRRNYMLLLYGLMAASVVYLLLSLTRV